jgi:hypothetical protein
MLATKAKPLIQIQQKPLCGQGVISGLPTVFGEDPLFKATRYRVLGVCAVEIPVAKKWHGEDSFLFF